MRFGPFKWRFPFFQTKKKKTWYPKFKGEKADIYIEHQTQIQDYLKQTFGIIFILVVAVIILIIIFHLWLVRLPKIIIEIYIKTNDNPNSSANLTM